MTDEKLVDSLYELYRWIIDGNEWFGGDEKKEKKFAKTVKLAGERITQLARK